MATAKGIQKHLNIALEEVGGIEPWFDKRFKTWIFSHSKYPVECSGDFPEKVTKNYPHYLRDSIEERLNSNLAPYVEKSTKGHGGSREGARRPKGTEKKSTTLKRKA